MSSTDLWLDELLAGLQNKNQRQTDVIWWWQIFECWRDVFSPRLCLVICLTFWLSLFPPRGGSRKLRCSLTGVRHPFCLFFSPVSRGFFYEYLSSLLALGLGSFILSQFAFPLIIVIPGDSKRFRALKSFSPGKKLRPKCHRSALLSRKLFGIITRMWLSQGMEPLPHTSLGGSSQLGDDFVLELVSIRNWVKSELIHRGKMHIEHVTLHGIEGVC